MRPVLSTLFLLLFVGASLVACSSASSSPVSPSVVPSLPVASSGRPSATASAAHSSSAPVPTRRSSPGSVATSSQSQFLPLAAGNVWTYRKSVSAKVHAWEAYGAVDGDSVQLAWGAPPDIRPGRTTETFKVIGRREVDGLGFWAISVSDPSARDGRYGAWLTVPDTILWGRVPSSEHIVEIDELMISESVFEGERRHRAPLLAQPLNEDVQVSLRPSGLPVEVSAAIQPRSVDVPAGHFDECLEVVTRIEGSDDQPGWTTYSCYVAGIGLVMEVQVDASGDPTYTMELVAYDLK